MRRFTLLSLLALSLMARAAEQPGKPAASPGYGQPVAPAAEPAKGQPRITFTECNVDGPFIAITFDDGPHDVQTPRVLKMLRERGIKATFFCVGQCVAQYPEVAKQIVTEGHEIANHSWNHPQLTKLGEGSVRDQIDRTHNVIKQTTGATPALLRPPYGAFTTQQRAWANALWKYKVILWDVDSLDWKHRSPAKTESIILGETKRGSIILCHDIHKTTIDAMPATLDALLAKGFKFVTVTELLAMHHEKAAKKGDAPKGGGEAANPGREGVNPAARAEDSRKPVQPAPDSPAEPAGVPARK